MIYFPRYSNIFRKILKILIDTIIVSSFLIGDISFATPVGVYQYKNGGTNGDMTITEISSCKINDTLGCVSEPPVLKAEIFTSTNSAHVCEVSGVEITSAWIVQDLIYTTLFNIGDGSNKVNPIIEFKLKKNVATIKLYRGELSDCGEGATIEGIWLKKQGWNKKDKK